MEVTSLKGKEEKKDFEDKEMSSPEILEKPVYPISFKPVSRWKKWGADLVKVALAFILLILAIIIWYQPPMIKADFPNVTYRFQGRTFTDAQLYRPLAVPTRFYIRLPHELARRYRWFTVDRRREIAALSEEPSRHFFNLYAIRRSDPLGLDLEFTKIDGYEWRVAFEPKEIVFSNAVLSIRLDIKKD